MEKNTFHKKKICQEEQCTEQWNNLSLEIKKQHYSSFIYCPFCANEMIIRCSSCNESLSDITYRFCPWCGVNFE